MIFDWRPIEPGQYYWGYTDSGSGIDLWIRVSTHRNTWTYGSYTWYGWRAMITDSAVRTSRLDYIVAAIIINRQSIECMIHMILNEYDSVTWYWMNMTVLLDIEWIWQSYLILNDYDMCYKIDKMNRCDVCCMIWHGIWSWYDWHDIHEMNRRDMIDRDEQTWHDLHEW